MQSETTLPNTAAENPVVELAKAEERAASNTEQKFQTERRETQDAVSATATKAFDAIQAREDAAPRMPTPMAATGKDIGEAVDRSSRWLDTPIAERKALAEAHEDIEQRRAEAAKLGLTLQEREAIIAAEQRKTAAAEQSEFEPVKASYRELYPEAKPAEVAQRYGEIDKFIRKNPAAGIRWLAEQYGVDVSQLGQPPVQQSADPVRAALDSFASQHADWRTYGNAMVQAINSGAIPRTADYAADLAAAYRYVKARTKEARPKPKGKTSWQDIASTIERVGKEIESRA
jgi:hypothetical protein